MAGSNGGGNGWVGKVLLAALGMVATVALAVFGSGWAFSQQFGGVQAQVKGHGEAITDAAEDRSAIRARLRPLEQGQAVTSSQFRELKEDVGEIDDKLDQLLRIQLGPPFGDRE